MIAKKSGFKLSSDLSDAFVANDHASFYMDANRSDLIQQLDHHWRYSKSVVLQGAKGVGKTSLIRQFQSQLSDEIALIYIDANVLGHGEDIINFMSETLGLDGGPIRTRREKIERIMQHAELEADMGNYVLLVIDHFDKLSDSTQRFFWQIAAKTHSQLRQIFVVDSFQIKNTVLADNKDLPVLSILPLQLHKLIHYLNDRLSAFGCEIYDIIDAQTLEHEIAKTGGDMYQIHALLTQWISASVPAADTPTSRLPSFKILGIGGVVIALTIAIYVGLTREELPAKHDQEQVSVNVPLSFHPVVEKQQEIAEADEDQSVTVADSQSIELNQIVTEQTPVDASKETMLDKALVVEKDAATVPKKVPLEAAVQSEPNMPVTIQLMGVSDKATLQTLLENHPSEPLEILTTRREGQDWYVLVYGKYFDKNSAREALKNVPKVLQKAQPWVRYRAEI